MFDACGLASHKHVASPVISGAEHEVPLILIIEPFSDWATVLKPCAQTSGLTLLSYEGPRELKFVIIPVSSTAPTVKTFIASAGVVILTHLFAPSFPALTMINIPFEGCNISSNGYGVVLPSMSI